METEKKTLRITRIVKTDINSVTAYVYEIKKDYQDGTEGE